MKQCNKCKEYKSLDEFHTAVRNKGGKYHTCKQCRKDIDKEYYQTSTKQVKCAEYRSKLISIRKTSKTGKRCKYCLENDECCLDYHHIDPKNKFTSVSQAKSIPVLKKEIPKCELICSNCHRKLHAGRKLCPLSVEDSTQLYES